MGVSHSEAKVLSCPAIEWMKDVLYLAAERPVSQPHGRISASLMVAARDCVS